jgi:hypothetical protein
MPSLLGTPNGGRTEVTQATNVVTVKVRKDYVMDIRRIDAASSQLRDRRLARVPSDGSHSSIHGFRQSLGCIMEGLAIAGIKKKPTMLGMAQKSHEGRKFAGAPTPSNARRHLWMQAVSGLKKVPFEFNHWRDHQRAYCSKP